MDISKANASALENRHIVVRVPTEFWLLEPGEKKPAGAVIAVPSIVDGYDLVMRPIKSSERTFLHA